MNPDYKQKWIAALRSGQYRQAQERLRKDGAFCCLGVLCDITKDAVRGDWDDDDGFNIDGIYEWQTLPDQVSELVALDDDKHDALTHMNDVDGKSFAEIADYIEANL